MSHDCHAIDCTAHVPPEMLMCGKHWRRVPRRLQQEVWVNYRRGQCDDWNPSNAYCRAAKAAVIAVAQAEGKVIDPQDPKLILYDLFEQRSDSGGITPPVINPGDRITVAMSQNQTTNTNTKPTTRRAASVDPDAMIQTGLANNFRGAPTIRYTIRKYEKGKFAGTYYPCAQVDITTDDPGLGNGGVVTEYYSIGKLNEWVPSNDGETPLELSFDDYLILHKGEQDVDAETLARILGTHLAPHPKGAQANVPNNTKWAQLTRSIKACGFPKERMGASCDFIDGVDCEWVRLPYEDSKGQRMKNLEEGQREPETLCVTNIDMDTLPASGKGKVAAAGATKPTTTTTTTTTTPTNPPAADDFDARVDTVIVAALLTAPDNSLHKSKLGTPIVKALTGKDGTRAIKLLNNNDWLAAGLDREAGYMFDVDSGTLTLLPS